MLGNQATEMPVKWNPKVLDNPVEEARIRNGMLRAWRGKIEAEKEEAERHIPQLRKALVNMQTESLQLDKQIERNREKLSRAMDENGRRAH